MLLSIHDLTIQASGQPFFEHTSWEIQQGEHWAILGPTGAGKSLLVKAISRQLPLSHGQIVYFFDGPQGRPYLNRDEILIFSSETHREFLRQFAGYHQARWQSFEGEDSPTVAGLLEWNSLFSVSPYEVISPENLETFQELKSRVLELFDLAPLLDRKAHQLSHGESRKVFLVRLLLRSPRLLILDDPFTGLDEVSRNRLYRGIDQLLQNQEPAILLVSSRREDIPPRIDRFLIVEEQRVVAQVNRSGLEPELDTRPPSLPVTPPQTLSPSAFRARVEQYTRVLANNAAASAAPIIEMRNVSVQYGESHILQEIHWTVQPGERWALLGSNGAGKTTLLSLILADNPQAYGNDIYLFGNKRGSGESIWEIKQKIGWVSPELQLFYEKTATCRDVIASGFFDSVGLYRHYSAEQAEIVDGWVQALGFDLHIDQPFSTLSTGQQRLVLLARALVKHPPLLVLDEPCQGLDEAHRAHFIHLIESLCQHTPVTLIYVTHYRDEIPSTVTHQLQLHQGRVQEMGPYLAQMNASKGNNDAIH